MSHKPNPIELESLRSELIEKTINSSSNFLRLYLYQNYFKKVLPLNNPNIEEAFLKEFLDDYIACICKFEVWGVEPEITKTFLEQLKNISQIKIVSENTILLSSEIDRIAKQLEKLNLILDGKVRENGIMDKAFFPLIDKESPSGFYGLLDSVTVRINKTTEDDKFIIVPSEKEIEERIFEQCKKSWFVARELSKKFIKQTSRHHEVIISFDKKEGFYEGNSLGIALTLSFLEQLLKFYNPAYIINIKEQSAFTGGVTEAGEVLCTSEEIIKRKVAAVFFSEINTFVFPKCEETYAFFALTQLKKTYPNRKLKLIPVEDISDIINRRDVVDIKKQKLVIRGGKFVKKNWISAVATVLLAILFGYLFVMDFDDNPSSFSVDGQLLYIKNKNGKILWRKNLIIADNFIDNLAYLNRSIKIVDIDNHGRNEIIIIENGTLLVCFDAFQKKIWEYEFEDSVSSLREDLNTQYSQNIIDTITIDNKKYLLLIASNGPSFSSAIFRVDLQTGQRCSGTLWAAGHFMDAIILDFDNNGISDVIGAGYDNGYEDLVFFRFELDTVTTVRPTKKEYMIKSYPAAEMIAYIRFPKTDFDNIFENRTPGYLVNSLINQEKYKIFAFAASIPRRPMEMEVSYEVDYNFKDITIVINSNFRVQRDSMVARGILNPPYTDTEEYKNIIKSNILYWKDGEWVKRDELD